MKAHKCKPIRQLAEEIGLKDYELYGDYKAKVTAKVPKKLSENRGKYVIVCGEFEFRNSVVRNHRRTPDDLNLVLDITLISL